MSFASVDDDDDDDDENVFDDCSVILLLTTRRRLYRLNRKEKAEFQKNESVIRDLFRSSSSSSSKKKRRRRIPDDDARTQTLINLSLGCLSFFLC